MPTDVEVGPHGLYVTTLPGGAGGLGSVHRIGGNRHPSRIATGFNNAANLAIGSHGTIYVAELASGMISKVEHGRPKQVASLSGVAALEWSRGHLYASTARAAAGGEGPGSIVRLG